MSGVQTATIMRYKTLNILTTWPFLLSLVTLLANDWWLKTSYPSVITGKLSDFSGMAIVALLLLASLPHRKWQVFFVILGAFAWWKSPLSDPFLHFINDLIPIQMGRTVDYSDLWTLTVLPACYYVVLHQPKFSVSSSSAKKTISIPLAAVTLLAIMGTSVIPTRQEYVIRPISPAVEIKRNQLIKSIALVAEEHGLTCEECSADSASSTCVSDDLSMSYSISPNNAVSFTIEAFSIGFFFGKSREEMANALRESLKSLLGERFEGLEYVEPLKSKDNQYETVYQALDEK